MIFNSWSMVSYTGEFAAITTAALWAWNVILFTDAGREIGSAAVNRHRLLFAFIVLMIIHTIWYGSPLPLDAGLTRTSWLALSGLIGFVIGDALLFEALVRVGARITSLLMTLVPVFGAIVAWLFPGEKISLVAITGIVLTTLGIALVILFQSGSSEHRGRYNTVGILLAVGGAAGQAVGLVFSKLGLTGDYSPLSGTLIRVMTGMFFVWGFVLVRLPARRWFAGFGNRRAIRAVLIGSMIGPVLGVGLSLLAVQKTAVGVAASLMNFTPIFVMLIYWLQKRETIKLIELAGTIIAVSGAVLFFI